jgi:hypothetical protein
MRQKRTFALVVVGVFVACGVPAITEAQTPPSYAHPSYASDEETVHGRISSFDGQYDLQVRDDRGFIDHLHMRPGTVINPTGLRLVPGMSVSAMGYNRGKVFDVNEIDTPYTSTYPEPAYDSYGPLYYGYGPYYPYYYPNVIFAPGFGWGGRGGWHGGGGRRR